MDVRYLSGWLLGLMLLPHVSVAAGKCERLIVTGSPDAPPYLWRDPADPVHLIGASADLLQQVGQDLGIKVEVLYGGKRSEAQNEVRTGRMDMLVDAPLTLAGPDCAGLHSPAAGAQRLFGLDPRGLVPCL